jgi:hypothetical protein
MGTPTSAGQPGPGEPGGVFRAELATDPMSARQARATVRQALAAWGIDDPSGDAELLASGTGRQRRRAHTGGQHIGLVLRRHTEPDGQRGVTCEVTDTSPSLPRPRQASTSDERGRGLAIVAALAAASGVRPEASGKTAGSPSACPAAQPLPARPPSGTPSAYPKPGPDHLR